MHQNGSKYEVDDVSRIEDNMYGLSPEFARGIIEDVARSKKKVMKIETHLNGRGATAESVGCPWRWPGSRAFSDEAERVHLGLIWWREVQLTGVEDTRLR